MDADASAVSDRLERLRRRWALIAGSGTTASKAVEDLLSRWGEPHRRYHTTEHLEDVLVRLDVLGDAPVAVQFAAWYHDAVYSPLEAANEEASAVLAVETLALLTVDARTVSEVARLVRLTATHDPDDGDLEGGLLCDADLAVLGQPSDGYEAYRRQVRREYGHVDDAAWRVGRASVLERFLSRPRIYATETARERWEQAARSNLLSELDQLRRD